MDSGKPFSPHEVFPWTEDWRVFSCVSQPEFGFSVEGKPEESLTCRLYAVMTNQHGMDQLLGLWKQWHEDPDKRAAKNFGPYKNVFAQMRDIRRWSVTDRLRETQALEYWQQNLEFAASPVRFEIELWFRDRRGERQPAEERIRRLITDGRGTVIAQSVIPDIQYHGILAELPSASLSPIVESIVKGSDSEILRCDDVMFFRPHAQAQIGVENLDEVEQLRRRFGEQKSASGAPSVALLDGLPLENHVALSGRILVDDPDDIGSRYTPGEQIHGTAMASLICHGELDENQDAISRPVYCRPILVPNKNFQGDVIENVPDDLLFVDLIHRAIRRMKVGEDGAKAIAPSVQAVNLSVANTHQPFVRELSPLARLLDWLAWKYNVLFIVSCGNHADDIVIPSGEDGCRDWPGPELSAKAMTRICEEQRHRRPLAPSEAVNVITVGTVHADSSSLVPGDRRVDLLNGQRLPSPINCVAAGYLRSLKPDILLPGGRQLYDEKIGNPEGEVAFAVSKSLRAPGQRVASPGTRPNELNRTVYLRGTSNATALATRVSSLVHERLVALQSEPFGDQITDESLPLFMKALLGHGASWGVAADRIDDVFRPQILASLNGNRRKAASEVDRVKNRFLGYGEVDPERSQFATDERITFLGTGVLSTDEGNRFELPLPPSLSGQRIRRRVTMTLAWFTPVSVEDRKYRKALLWARIQENVLGLKRINVDSSTSQRGTVQHRVLEGTKAVPITDGDVLPVTVSCAENAGKLVEPIRFALAVSIEVAEPIGVSIYDEVQTIRERLSQRIEIGVRK